MNNSLIKRISLLVIILIISLSSFGCSQKKESIKISDGSLTMEQKLEDFEYLYNLFKDNYPFLEVNKRLNGIDWLANKDDYIKKIKNTTTDEEFIQVIKEILNDLNNGHVNLIDKDYFPYVYVGMTDQINGEWIKPWGEVLKREAVLNRYDFNEYEVKKLRKEIHEIYNNPSNPSFSPAFETNIIVPDEVAYVYIKKMNGMSAIEDGKNLRKFYKEIKDYEKLIIDIRGNTGGSVSYWIENVIEPLIKDTISVDYYLFARGDYAKPFFEAKGIDFKPLNSMDKEILEKIPSDVRENFDKYCLSKLTIEPKDSIKFDGKIYLLVDSNVFSSSEAFAAFCKDSGFATIVGETTGGDGIGIDPIYYSLPNSGLVGRFSSVLGLNGDFTINEEVKTIPHVKINNIQQLPLHNYKYDEAVQYVIRDRL